MTPPDHDDHGADRLADFTASVEAAGVRAHPWAKAYLEGLTRDFAPIMGAGSLSVLVTYDPLYGVIVSFGSRLGGELTPEHEYELTRDLLQMAYDRNEHTKDSDDGVIRTDVGGYDS